MKRYLFNLSTFILWILIVSSCSNTEKTIYIAAKISGSEMWSIVNVETGDILYKDEFKNEPSIIINDVFYVKNSNGTYDYYNIDDVKKPLNNESYIDVTPFSENGKALAVKKGKTISIIDADCNEVKVLPSNIKNACTFSKNGFSLFKDVNGKFGYINDNGDVVLQAKYDYAEYFSDDEMAVVGVNINDSVVKFSLIDSSGKEQFSFSSTEYERHGNFIDGLIPVLKGNDVIYLDKNGKKIFNAGKKQGDYFSVSSYRILNGVTKFSDGKLYGLMNKKGEVLIRAKYDELVLCREEGLYLAKKGEKFGVIDSDDNAIIPFEYKIIFPIINERYVVEDDKSVNIIDKDGNDVGIMNFVNMSLVTSSFFVTSNYFDAKANVSSIFEMLTDSTCCRAKPSSTLADFRDLTSGFKYSDSNTNYVTENKSPYTIEYVFNTNLVLTQYEYFYGVKLEKGREYNWSAKIDKVVVKYNLKDFDESAVESFVKEFERVAVRRGYTINNGLLENKNGTALTIGYKDGEIVINFYYNKNQVSAPIREKRSSDRSQSKSSNEEYDIFGIDSKESIADSAAVDSGGVTRVLLKFK